MYLLNAGMATAARMPMIATTIMSSTSVKPEPRFRERTMRILRLCFLSVGLRKEIIGRDAPAYRAAITTAYWPSLLAVVERPKIGRGAGEAQHRDVAGKAGRAVQVAGRQTVDPWRRHPRDQRGPVGGAGRDGLRRAARVGQVGAIDHRVTGADPNRAPGSGPSPAVAAARGGANGIEGGSVRVGGEARRPRLVGAGLRGVAVGAQEQERPELHPVRLLLAVHLGQHADPFGQ